MLVVKEIAFVGYPTRDRAKAVQFYEGLLGLSPTLHQDMGEHFWTEYDLGPSTLALSNYWEPPSEPAMGPIAALEVGNYDETIARLKEHAVPILETHESPVCFMTMVADPDGNSLWIHQRKGAPISPEKVLAIPFICYPVADRERAYNFYGGLFGLTRTQPDYVAPDGFWSEYNIATGTLALCSFWKPSARPSMGPSIALEMEDFDLAVAGLQAAGASFPLAPMETPICHLCAVTDPDGNSLFIHQRKPASP